MHTFRVYHLNWVKAALGPLFDGEGDPFMITIDPEIDRVVEAFQGGLYDYVGKVSGGDVEEAWFAAQNYGNGWSDKPCRLTCIGDVLVDEDNNLFVVKPIGFEKGRTPSP